jgi:ribosomal-protein-alanine N-acetyltransferase
VIIRNATILDIPDIVKIAERNFITPWTPHAVLESIHEKSVYVVVNSENAIIGYVIIYQGFDSIEIMNIAVEEKHKRRGVGKALLSFMIDNYSENNEIWLEVRDNNTPAIALYKGLGFENIGIRKGFYRDETPPRDALTMKYQKKD